MANPKLTPLQYVMKKLDIELKDLVKEMGVSLPTAYRWKRECKGDIPKKYHKQIIRLAKERSERMFLTEEELTYGGVYKDEC